MLGLVVYAAMLAYGRISKSFGPIPWLIAAALALATTMMSANMLNIAFDTRLILPVLLQFAILAVLYAAGAGVGRYLDRNKNLD
jgi:hypothetical protein